eukprot:1492631-Prymnesium_polylepis.1
MLLSHAQGDPHLKLAKGGHADFRGAHGRVFVSMPLERDSRARFYQTLIDVAVWCFGPPPHFS